MGWSFGALAWSGREVVTWQVFRLIPVFLVRQDAILRPFVECLPAGHVEEIGSMQRPGRAEMLMLIRKRNGQACLIRASSLLSAYHSIRFCPYRYRFLRGGQGSDRRGNLRKTPTFPQHLLHFFPSPQNQKISSIITDYVCCDFPSSPLNGSPRVIPNRQHVFQSSCLVSFIISARSRRTS